MSYNELHVLTIGKKHNEFSVSPNVNDEGAFFYPSDQGEMMELVINLRNMSTKEKRELKNGVFQIKAIQDGNYILLFAKFGSELMFEIPFETNIFGEERFIKGQSIMIVGVETNGSIINVIRPAKLPDKVFEAIRTSWQGSLVQEDFATRYQSWKEKYNSYSRDELWNAATIR